MKTNKIEFFIPMIPPTVTFQEKEIKVVKGKPIVYDSQKLKQARVKLTGHLSQYVPEEPYTQAVRCITKWCFPIKNKKHKNGDWKETPPDTHNMNKMLFDIMETLGYWKNDSLVTSEINEKFWADEPGLYILIEPLVERSLK